MRNKTTLSSNLGLDQTRISAILFNLHPFYSDTKGPPRLQKHCCTSSRSERANAIMSQFSRKGTGVKKSFAGVKKKQRMKQARKRIALAALSQSIIFLAAAIGINLFDPRHSLQLQSCWTWWCRSAALNEIAWWKQQDFIEELDRDCIF